MGSAAIINNTSIKVGSGYTSGSSRSSTGTTTLFTTAANQYARVFINIDISTAYQSSVNLLVGATIMSSKTIGTGAPATGSMGLMELIVPQSSSLGVYLLNYTSGTVTWGVSAVIFENSP